MLFALALSTAVSAQIIPERAQWEITFAQVEERAALLDLRTSAPGPVEARIMLRPWSASAALPFLRIVRSDDDGASAQLFAFWRQQPWPTADDDACRDRVCVKASDLKEQLDWREVLASLNRQHACPRDPNRTVTVCGDCPQLWIKTSADGNYREQSCPTPDAGTVADTLLQFMHRVASAGWFYRPLR
jgi:hypothetical protein